MEWFMLMNTSKIPVNKIRNFLMDINDFASDMNDRRLRELLESAEQIITDQDTYIKLLTENIASLRREFEEYRKVNPQFKNYDISYTKQK
jgi:hypothetical protein